MPEYKEQPCEGTCERFGNKCFKPDLYTEVAERYNAEPEKFEGTIRIGHRKVPWSFCGLNIQGPKRKQAINDLARKMKESQPVMPLKERRVLAEKYHLKELPCYLECTITLCIYCGNPHEDYMVRHERKTCDVLIALKEKTEQSTLDHYDQENGPKSEEETEEGDVLETEYIDPLWPKKEAKNDDDET